MVLTFHNPLTNSRVFALSGRDVLQEHVTAVKHYAVKPDRTF